MNHGYLGEADSRLSCLPLLLRGYFLCFFKNTVYLISMWKSMHFRDIYGIIKQIYVEVNSVAVSYNKLWKLFIDRKMRKKDLQAASNISASLITKLGRDEPVTTTVLMKICSAMSCDIGDIMEIIPDEPNRGR